MSEKNYANLVGKFYCCNVLQLPENIDTTKEDLEKHLNDKLTKFNDECIMPFTLEKKKEKKLGRAITHVFSQPYLQIYFKLYERVL